MSTTPRSDKPSQPSSSEADSAASETTVFFRPSFGITVQSSTLCVSVSAKANTTRSCPPSCG